MKTLLLTERELHRIISLLVEIAENKRKFLEKRYLGRLGSDLFEKIIKVDPTDTNKYSEWIMLKVINKSIEPNEINDVLAEYLTLFDTPKVKNKLSKKDIFQYKTINDLALELEPHKEAMARGDFDSKPEVLKKTYIGRAGRFKVYIPNTYHQSCIIGSGARWCTAADSGEGKESFKRYTTDNRKLYIFVDGDEKYQFTSDAPIGGSYTEFKNKENEDVAPPKEIFMWLVDNNLTEINFVDKLRYGLALTEDDLVVKGDLALATFDIKKLPKGLRVEGSLFLGDNKIIKELPDDLWVGGHLDLRYGSIEKLGDNTYVGETLNLEHSPLLELPENLHVKKLKINRTSIEKLPDSLKLEGDLDIRHTKIKELPNTIEEYPGDLDLRATVLEKLPPKLKVKGDLYITNNMRITELPTDLSVGGELFLRNINITELPDGLNVLGGLYLDGLTNLKKIGNNTFVREELQIKECPQLKELPDRLTVHGTLKLKYSSITKIGRDVTVGRIDFFESVCEEIGDYFTIVKGSGEMLHFPRTIKYIGDNFKSVGGISVMHNKLLKKLPNNMEIGGDLHMGLTNIERIGANTTVDGHLAANNVKSLKELPSNLDVGGELIVTSSGVMNVGRNIKAKRLEAYMTPLAEKFTKKQVWEMTGKHIEPSKISM